jgi:hypothetical protein
VRLRAASQGQVAEAFGVDPATVWRWDQALASAGVAGLVPARRGPEGASKLTSGLAARITDLDAAGQTLRQIAAATGVRAALGRVGPGGPDTGGDAGQDSGPDQGDSETAWDEPLPVLPVLPDPRRPGSGPRRQPVHPGNQQHRDAHAGNGSVVPFPGRTPIRPRD